MALEFDGESTYLRQGTPPVSGPIGTIACWFRPDGLSGAGAVFTLVSLPQADDSLGLYLAVRIEFGGGLKVVAQTMTAGNSSTTALDSDVWAHACGVFYGASARAAFLDGAGKALNTTGPLEPTCDRLEIGARVADDDRHFRGLIAHVGIWEEPLDDDEVAALARRVSPLRVRPGALRMYRAMIGDEDVDLVGGASWTDASDPAPQAAETGLLLSGPAPPIVGYEQAHLPGHVVHSVRRSPTGLAAWAFDWVAGPDGAARLALDGVAAPKMSGRLHRVVTVPGTPRPRAGWNARLVDRLGDDVLEGAADGRSDTLLEQAHVLSPITGAHASDLATVGTLEFRILGAGRNGAGRTIIYTTPV